MTLNKSSKIIKEVPRKIKSLERIPLNPVLLSQGAPLHTLPSFVSSGLPTRFPDPGTKPLSCPKAAINPGQLGVSQVALAATTKELLGDSEQTQHEEDQR